MLNGNYIYLKGTVHPYTGNTYDLGTSGNRWRYLYTNNSVNTSDRRLKNSITGSDLGLDFVNSLNPIRYKLNDAETPRYHYGFVAQEITSSLEQFGHTSDTAGFIYSSSLDTDLIALKGWEDRRVENYQIMKFMKVWLVHQLMKNLDKLYRTNFSNDKGNSRIISKGNTIRKSNKRF